MRRLAGFICMLLALAVAQAACAAGLSIREGEGGQRIATGTVVFAGTAEIYGGLAQARPSVAVLRVDEALAVLGDEGGALDTLEGALATLGGRMALGFAVETWPQAQAVTAALPRDGGPFLLISDDAEVLRQAMDEKPDCLLVLNREALAAPQGDGAADAVEALRRETAACGAVTVLLGPGWAQPACIAALQRELVSVWLAAGEDTSPTALMRLITAGPYAVASRDMAAVEACLALLGDSAVTRRVFLSGHRGAMNLAPENTLYAIDAGIEAGCDILEIDVALTRDGEVVLMHDREVFRTTGGPGTVERLTLEKLQALDANYEWQGDNRFAGAKVPTLDEVLAHVKGRGVSLMIEIKGSEVALMEKIAALVEAYDMADCCTVISNNYVNIAVMKKQAPWMARGLLANKMFDSKADPAGAMDKALSYATKYSSHIFPDGTGQRGEAYVQAMAKLGLGTIAFAWTEESFDDAMRRGLYAVCTNDPDWGSAYACAVTPGDAEVALAVGEALTLRAMVETYGAGSFDTGDIRIIPVEGAAHMAVEDSAITGVSAGTASIILEYTQATALGNAYRLYTQPVAVRVQ